MQMWQIPDIQCSGKPVSMLIHTLEVGQGTLGVGRWGSKSVLDFLDNYKGLLGSGCVLACRTTGRNNRFSNLLWTKHTCLVLSESFRG